MLLCLSKKITYWNSIDGVYLWQDSKVQKVESSFSRVINDIILSYQMQEKHHLPHLELCILKPGHSGNSGAIIRSTEVFAQLFDSRFPRPTQWYTKQKKQEACADFMFEKKQQKKCQLLNKCKQSSMLTSAFEHYVLFLGINFTIIAKQIPICDIITGADQGLSRVTVPHSTAICIAFHQILHTTRNNQPGTWLTKEGKTQKGLTLVEKNNATVYVVLDRTAKTEEIGSSWPP